MRMVVATKPEDLPRIVRAAMASKGMTHTQLAEHLGFTTKHMSQMMCGRAPIKMSVLFEMLGYLDVAVALIPQRQVEG